MQNEHKNWHSHKEWKQEEEESWWYLKCQSKSINDTDMFENLVKSKNEEVNLKQS